MNETNLDGLINNNSWIFAKTYASFAPHEYLVKSRLSSEYRPIFEEFAKALYASPHVRIETKFKRLWSYLYIGEYKYWCHAKPIITDKENIFLENEEMFVYSQVKGSIFELVTLNNYAEKKCSLINRTQII